MEPVAEKPVIEPPDPRSSMLKRVPEDIRQMVDRSIVENDPPGYKACYARWELEAYGVSFTAFYMYARRLRRQAAALHLRELTEAPEADFTERLPGLVAQRLIEHLTYGEPARPLDLHRLLSCYRTAIDTVRQGRAAAAEGERIAYEARMRRTPTAAWGRKEDGTPYTHAEFLKTLHEAVADIYGVDMNTGTEVFRPMREAPTPPGATGVSRPDVVAGMKEDGAQGGREGAD